MAEARRSVPNKWLATALCGSAFVVAFALMVSEGRMGVTFEFPEYADIAREVARGNGFSTHVLYPSVLAYADRAGVEAGPGGAYPVLNRHPGFAFALAPFVAVLGADDLAVQVALAAFFASWILVSYLVLSRLLGPGESVAASLLLLANPAFVRFFVPGGYADILFATLTLAFLYGASDLLGRDDRKPWHWLALGLLGALCWHVRFNFSLILALTASAALLPRPDGGRIAAAGALVGGYVLGMLPFETWQWITFGTTQSPPSLWNLLDGFPGYASPWSQYRTFGIDDVLANGNWHLLLSEKFPFYMAMTLRDLPVMLLYVAAFPFFLVALLRGGGGPAARRFLLLSSACLAAMLVIMAFFRFENWTVPGAKHLSMRYYIWFAPVLAGFAVAGLQDLLSGRGARTRAAVVTFAAAVQVAYFAMYWNPLAEVYDVQGAFGDLPVARAVERLQAEGTLSRDLPLMTNMPAQVAWYMDRPAIMLPRDPARVAELVAHHPVGGLLFTGLPMGEPGTNSAWMALFSDAARRDEYLARSGLEVAWSDQANVLLVPARAPR